MLKTRVALLGLLALLAVSGSATSAASAAGPFWHVNGVTLKGTRQVKLQNKGPMDLSVPNIGLEVLCRSSASEGATIEGNGVKQGQGKGRITFSSCKSNEAECHISEPIITTPTKSYLAKSPTQTKDVEVLEPGSGILLVTIKIFGESCLLAGSYDVTGGVVAEITPTGNESQVGMLDFPAEPITKVKHEGIEKTIEMKTNTSLSFFETVYGARLQSGERFGVFET